MTTAADWTATTDKLPADGQPVFFYTGDSVFAGFYQSTRYYVFTLGSDIGGWPRKDVTHWQPRHIPAPPQKPQANAFETWWSKHGKNVSCDVVRAAYDDAAASERERFAAGVEKLGIKWREELADGRTILTDLRALAAGKDGGV